MYQFLSPCNPVSISYWEPKSSTVITFHVVTGRRHSSVEREREWERANQRERESERENQKERERGLLQSDKDRWQPGGQSTSSSSSTQETGAHRDRTGNKCKYKPCLLTAGAPKWASINLLLYLVVLCLFPVPSLSLCVCVSLSLFLSTSGC